MKRALVLIRIVMALLIAVALVYLAYGFKLAPPSASQDWAAWAQAFGATVALGIAIYIPYRQRVDEKADHEAREDERKALTLLTLQEISAEVAQIIILSGFQKDNPQEAPIYPNIADEFTSMAESIDRFPIDRFIEVGKAEQLRALRRVCRQMALLHRADSGLNGAQFNSKHRNQVDKLESVARKMSLALKDDVERLCPGKFTERLRTHL